MKVYRFKPPYNRDGKINLPTTINRSGVYLIAENDKIVYVGYSATNLYKTLYHHFQKWNDHKQYRVSYTYKLKMYKYTVRIVYCTPAQAYRLEAALILKYKPRDNGEKYEAYELDARDKKLLHEYDIRPVERDAPF